MSSYFDAMSVVLNDKLFFVQLIRKQYQRYLHKLSSEVLVKDVDKLNEIIRKFEAVDLYNNELDQVIEIYHDIAHELGRMQIHLRGGRIAVDNPMGITF